MPAKKRPAKKKKKAAPKAKAKAKAKAKKQPAPSKAERVSALAKVFQALGARDPESWAKRHVEQNSDELGRFMLLRALWLRLVEPGRLLATAQNDAVVGPTVEKMMKTSSLADLDALVRFAQRTAVADVCRVLDDPGDADGIRWSLFRVDAQGLPLWPLTGLRADLDGTEP